MYNIDKMCYSNETITRIMSRKEVFELMQKLMEAGKMRI